MKPINEILSEKAIEAIAQGRVQDAENKAKSQSQAETKLRNKRKAAEQKCNKEAKPLTEKQKEIINTAVEIKQDRYTSKDIAFMSKSLVIANLPHSKPKTDVWTRKNGRFTLGIQAGYNYKKGESYGLPYGSIPRLGLIYIITKAIKTQSRRIELGSTINQFLRDIGLNPDMGSGKRSDKRRLLEQMERLFHCRISFVEELEDGKGNKGERRLNMQIARASAVWWSMQDADQCSLFDSFLELDEAFYEAIIANPIPFDLRAAIALKQSSLALDLYIFLCFEAFKVERTGEDRFISYASLAEQMGSSYSDPKDFKKRLKEALKKVRAVSNCVVLEVDGGILISKHSRPAIDAKPA